jgi:Uma2 family endonuclease
MAMDTAFRSDERFNQEEFLRWLEERPTSDTNRYELLDGSILMTPPSRFPHSVIAARIVAALDRHARSSGGGLVQESSAAFDLPTGDLLEPDVTFISAARLATGPKPQHNRVLQLVPDLVVEVLSPSTARRDRTEKKHAYERAGVAEYWLVDTERREVSIFTRQDSAFGEPVVLRSGAVVSGVARALDLTIEDLFAGLD